MTRIALVIPLGIFAFGCGGKDQWKEAAENVRRGEAALEKRLKEIGEDKSLKDGDAVQKLLDALPSMQTNLPPGVAPGWAANTKNGEWHITIHATLGKQSENTSADERVQSERKLIHSQLIGCKRILTYLKERKVASVTVQIYTQLTGEEKYTELFRAVMTQADLPKVEKHPELSDPVATSAAGTVYDPRGPKIGECWKVELNRYPELEYKKK